MIEPARLPLDDVPPFREPWQAKAFALVVLLYREGHLTWDDWVRTLATEIANRPQHADETAEFAYHRQFLAALETITSAHGLISTDARVKRTEAWRRAYVNTPHGQPVELAAALQDGIFSAHAHDDHDHQGLSPKRMPLAISRGRKQN